MLPIGHRLTYYILCFAEMCLAGVLAYETLRVDAMALGAFAHLIAFDADPAPIRRACDPYSVGRDELDESQTGAIYYCPKQYTFPRRNLAQIPAWSRALWMSKGFTDV